MLRKDRPLNFSKIKKHMLTVNEEGITAEMLSAMVGVSRSTARRYLEYLISGKKFMQSLHMEVWGDQRDGIFLFLHNKNSSGYMSATVFYYIGIIPITIPVINMTIVVPTAHNKVKRWCSPKSTLAIPTNK